MWANLIWSIINGVAAILILNHLEKLLKIHDQRLVIETSYEVADRIIKEVERRKRDNVDS